ncbi:Y-box factor homolog [Ornithodoros turicata]|uniref:Y-box factor homolog n=1 Tax=Ornithodoros turicata TaxID=34597 RepID=UPI003139EF8F
MSYWIKKRVPAEHVLGTVKWFNVKDGYEFINRNNNYEDVFVHHTAIARNKLQRVIHSLGDGEMVKPVVVLGEKGGDAPNVTVPVTESVLGNPYDADRRCFHGAFFP